VAAEVWSALAPLLAGRGRVRESRSGGHTYLRRWERPLTSRLPAVPAAVPIYSGAGDTRVLVIDLDSSRGGAEAVRRDAAAVRELVWAAGGRVIADESPSGGMHVYVPFAAPIGFHQARDLALALAARTPTMDPSPNQNLTDGLIRPPGSVHPSGGHQVLHGTLVDAHHLASTGNPPAVLTALTGLLAAELAAVTAREQQPLEPVDPGAGPLQRRSAAKELPADYQLIARTGIYDTGKYRSPSEARQAVLTAAVWAGLTLSAVLARIENGTWPGMAAFYTRYRNPRTRRNALLADWHKALAYVTTEQAKKPTRTLVRKSPTSEPPSHGGGPPDFDQDQQRVRGTPAEYQWIRTWWSALSLLEHDRYGDRAGLGKRWVLRGIGEAAMKTGSRHVAFGTRSLSIATGLDHTTVAAHLRALREEDDPLIDLIENDRGLQGDLYQLRIPDEITARAGRVAWRAGKLHALRPVFRELGHPAAFVYEALEHSGGRPERSFDLITRTGLSRTAVYEALETLAAWHLVQPRDGRWVLVRGTSLQQLAEQFGCADTVRALLNRHRDERTQYRRALRIVDHHYVPALSSTGGYLWPPEPPPNEEALLELLERELGAHPIPVGA
jgi:DNA-binding transcriptional ArsR family regulator